MFTKSTKTLAATALALLILSLTSVAGAGPSGAGAEPVYYFVGHGRAHGVGMCMDGVYYMAQQGAEYHNILSYFYTGISFTQTDEARAVRVKGRDGQIRTWTLHDYLHHLQEEPDNYPLEELKALYVAARTYTLSVINRNKHTAAGFDICSSGECCQACDENKNIAAYPNNNAAVDATSGEIMTYNGQPITAAYCGSCGGHTENNEDVWGGTAIPYLRGKPDPYCQYSPRYEWRASFTKSQLEARLNSNGNAAVGALNVMDLASRTPGGRVKTARLVGSGGVRYVDGDELAGILGFSNTKFDLVRPNFDEYILVLNPNDEPAGVTFTFMKPDGTTSEEVRQVAPHARYTLKANDCIQFEEFSTRLVADRPVIAERAMYFNYGNRFNGGSGTLGVRGPKAKWYLAEGYTGGDFQTYVLVQNPSGSPADITYTFMLPGGKPPVTRTQQLPANSRTTLRLNDVPGLEASDVSTMVESTNGVEVVAERAMYFDYGGFDGGHAAVGVDAPAPKWYLAEGFTGARFETYILLQNPAAAPVPVEATFMKESGETVTQTYLVPAMGRYTIHADTVPGLEDAGFSTTLTAADSSGIIAERAMYFDYSGAGLDDGHGGEGVTAPCEVWYFAEGYTGGRFDTFVLVQNPAGEDAAVTFTFNLPNGASVERSCTVKAHSRFTLRVDDVEGLADAEVSTTVRSTNGVEVVAERAMYFVYSDGYCSRDGGHDSVGTPAPSATWYFAEGYTGF